MVVVVVAPNAVVLLLFVHHQGGWFFLLISQEVTSNEEQIFQSLYIPSTVSFNPPFIGIFIIRNEYRPALFRGGFVRVFAILHGNGVMLGRCTFTL